MDRRRANEVMDLKRRLEEAEKLPAKIDGQLEQIDRSLKEHGIDDSEQVEAVLEKMKKNRKKLQAKYDSLLEEYEILIRSKKDGEENG